MTELVLDPPGIAIAIVCNDCGARLAQAGDRCEHVIVLQGLEVTESEAGKIAFKAAPAEGRDDCTVHRDIQPRRCLWPKGEWRKHDGGEP